MNSIVGATRYLLAGVFLYSAAMKWRSLPTFREQVAEYRLIPYGATTLVAWLVVVLETVAAVSLLFAFS